MKAPLFLRPRGQAHVRSVAGAAKAKLHYCCQIFALIFVGVVCGGPSQTVGNLHEIHIFRALPETPDRVSYGSGYYTYCTPIHRPLIASHPQTYVTCQARYIWFVLFWRDDFEVVFTKHRQPSKTGVTLDFDTFALDAGTKHVRDRRTVYGKRLRTFRVSLIAATRRAFGSVSFRTTTPPTATPTRRQTRPRCRPLVDLRLPLRKIPVFRC